MSTAPSFPLLYPVIPPHSASIPSPSSEIVKGSSSSYRFVQLETFNPSEVDREVATQESDNAKKAKRFGKMAMAIFSMGIGFIVAVGGTVMGVGIMNRLYLNTSLGIKIFKIFTSIFFPIGSALFVAAAALMTTPTTAIFLATPVGYIASSCFAVPFLPLALGGMGGLPGAKLTHYAYHRFKTIYREKV